MLTPAQIARLESLGFVWYPYAANWEEMFTALTAYRQQHGDCNVANRSTSYPDLGVWCATQRYARKKDRMPLERVARLEQLGFVWDAVVAKRDENWGEMLKALDAYKMAHGDCNVPARWKPNLQLGVWCARVRIARKDEKLSVEEIRRLDELGFCWDPLSVAWEEKFSALTVFKANHGHCDVPKRWKGRPGLGMWCSNQRTAYKGATLAADRVKRLSDIGFRFVVRAEPNTT